MLTFVYKVKPGGPDVRLADVHITVSIQLAKQGKIFCVTRGEGLNDIFAVAARTHNMTLLLFALHHNSFPNMCHSRKTGSRTSDMQMLTL